MFYLGINTNEIPNHFTFRGERRDLLCNRSNGDLCTCKDNMLFSRVKISCFRAKAHLVFYWCLDAICFIVGNYSVRAMAVLVRTCWCGCDLRKGIFLIVIFCLVRIFCLCFRTALCNATREFFSEVLTRNSFKTITGEPHYLELLVISSLRPSPVDLYQCITVILPWISQTPNTSKKSFYISRTKFASPRHNDFSHVFSQFITLDINISNQRQAKHGEKYEITIVDCSVLFDSGQYFYFVNFFAGTLKARDNWIPLYSILINVFFSLEIR